MEARRLIAVLFTFGVLGATAACATDLERDELESETEDSLKGGNCAKSKGPRCLDAGAADSSPDSAADGGAAVADAAPPPPPPPPTATTCSAFTYSAYAPCQPDGTQTRTVLTSSPAGCTGGAPVLSQTCTYTPPPPATCTSFTYSAYGACQPNGTQTRAVTSSSPAGCAGGAPVLSQACTYIDGAALYTQYCSGCHGVGKKGASAAATQGAIDTNRGGMGSLAFLTPAQIAAIAASP